MKNMQISIWNSMLLIDNCLSNNYNFFGRFYPEIEKGRKNMIVLSILQLIATVGAAVLIIPQIHLLNKQIKESHEEHRRENTTQIMHHWCDSLKKESAMAQNVVRKLNEEQCKHLYKREPFIVTDEVADSICKFCPLKDGCNDCSVKGEEGKAKTVDGKILNELRYYIISYLNILETVMTSWDLGIVDCDTIEEQFQFLVSEGKGLALGSFRRVAGGYPLIEKFVDKIKKTEQPSKEPL